jgi:hypothetical protein
VAHTRRSLELEAPWLQKRLASGEGVMAVASVPWAASVVLTMIRFLAQAVKVRCAQLAEAVVVAQRE